MLMARAGSSWAAAAAAALIGRDSQRLSAAAAAPQHAVDVAFAATRTHNAVPTTAARGLSDSGELASPKRRTQTVEGTESKAITPVKKRRKAALPAVTCLDPTLRAKALRIGEQLRAYTPSPKIPVDHNSHFQFLVAVILSAQSTDKKVNEVTPALFKAAPDAASMAAIPITDIEGMVRSVGLAPSKAKYLSRMSQMLLDEHDGQVPCTFELLEALPGVAHKTAACVMSSCFKQPAFAVDTHIHRLAKRWGLSDGKNVEQTEADLKALFPVESWSDCSLQMIYFGREQCPAKHNPESCSICSWAAIPPYDRVVVSPRKAHRKLGQLVTGDSNH